MNEIVLIVIHSKFGSIWHNSFRNVTVVNTEGGLPHCHHRRLYIIGSKLVILDYRSLISENNANRVTLLDSIGLLNEHSHNQRV